MLHLFGEDIHLISIAYARAEVLCENIEVLIEGGLGQRVKIQRVVGGETAFLPQLDGGVEWCRVV